MDWHFNSLSLNKKDCVRLFIADRMWDDQQSSLHELSCMSACIIFFALELLLLVKAFNSRTAARTSW